MEFAMSYLFYCYQNVIVFVSINLFFFFSPRKNAPQFEHRWYKYFFPFLKDIYFYSYRLRITWGTSSKLMNENETTFPSNPTSKMKYLDKVQKIHAFLKTYLKEQCESYRANGSWIITEITVICEKMCVK